MTTLRRGTAGTEPGGGQGSPTARRTAATLGALACLGLLTACGGDHEARSAQQTVAGEAPSASDGGSGAAAPVTGTGPGPGTPTAAGGSPARSTGTRCHTSDLRAAVGADNPGAGQENFPLVLTNRSGRTCTITGYPGAAFTDASGKQLGPDPRRRSGHPTKVTLVPGSSAWAGLSFSNPQVSGARAATPTAILITPPDERASLKVTWRGGPVPVSGNASTVFLTAFGPGTGP
jgi:hypothetical protein